MRLLCLISVHSFINTAPPCFLTECAQRKCSSFFESQRLSDEDYGEYHEGHDSGDYNETIKDITNESIRDFKGLDIDNKVEFHFFTHPAWKEISECGARTRLPPKAAPCEFYRSSCLLYSS